ncbi:hypothetical protein J0895_07935 [Phormidium pseudopriestleyi FRX01]|uniref:Uncharacterized protein n=1 Tax=Phormidium pseudopriestleyi FRX01 TaxID=1759528 RepID=A0ABS3FPJ3_9CYAN|nr:hypothetical protein [Phormidium pseudopriestleyi]MBO0349030.1 hypothetical protein [Phormidium pseudopriestleyi FRX01]
MGKQDLLGPLSWAIAPPNQPHNLLFLGSIPCNNHRQFQRIEAMKV